MGKKGESTHRTTTPRAGDAEASKTASDKGELSVLKSVIDSIEDVIYVADPATYELVFVNETCRKYWGEDILGHQCYRVLQGREEPCPFCTNEIILGEFRGRSYIWEFQNELTKNWYRCTDRAIEWPDGRTLRFELASDITSLKKAEAALLQQQETLENEVAERTRELSEKAAALRTAGEYNRSLIEAGMDPLLVISKDGCITDANSSALSITGRSRDTLLGSRFTELLSNTQHASHVLESVLQGNPIRDLRAAIKHADKSTTPVTLCASAYRKLDETAGVLVTARDIRARLAAEAAIKHSSRITNAVNRVFREALTCESEEVFAQRSLEIAEELTGSAFGFIGDINEEGRFDTIGLSNPGWEACSIDGTAAAMLIKGMELRGIWSSVLRTGDSLVENNPADSPDSVGVPRGHPKLNSFLGVPFLQDGRAVGMIALANKEEGYTDNDREAIEALAAAFHQAMQRKRLEVEVSRQARIKNAQAEFLSLFAGDPALKELGTLALNYLCQTLNVPAALIYTETATGIWSQTASYAFRPSEAHPAAFKVGEGLVGQVAQNGQQMLLQSLPADYFRLESGLGSAQPNCLLLKPILRNNKLRAVLELAFHQAPDNFCLDLLAAITECLASAIESTQARDLQAQLLSNSQEMTEELQSQQEELRAANEELEEQARRLQDSESRLLNQQAELQAANEELEEKTELLERQKQDVESARHEISRKADELSRASKYKSMFLANMSHELRTPLNSLLLLARSLADNRQGHLSEEEVHSAEIIHQSGNDLLSLINDILDLTKIEAGHMDLQWREMNVEELASCITRTFEEQARHRGITLVVEVKQDVPETIRSDQRRLEQVLKNLCSNAIKFTEKGEVRVTFSPGREGVLRITVKDTGIGIPKEHHDTIFEAFRQVDGGSARKYGGTGLGLSIVKQLLNALGGKIELESKVGSGSCFRILMPTAAEESIPAPAAAKVKTPAPPSVSSKPQCIDDDRDKLNNGDRCILLIEDDMRFASILSGHCQEQGLRVLAAATGETGLELAEKYLPSGILLDLHLPGIDGWQVLDMLKASARTRHIPVHIISADERGERSRSRGAIGHLSKPVSAEEIQQAIDALTRVSESETKRVLIVEDDAATRAGLRELISEPRVLVEEATSLNQVRSRLSETDFDCIVLDLSLQDGDSGQLLKKLEQEGVSLPPVIVYTARELSWEEDLDLRSRTSAIVIKGAHSDERLLDEVSLFLHQVVSEMPEQKRQIIADLHDSDRVLRNKQILLVDDDMRTLFALTKLLSDRGMIVHKADNGESALTLLNEHSDIDLVLMDIMMPVMDGYETMSRIRQQERFRKLPIVALTAKAMREDNEKCMQAGANDYMSKPVDANRLLSMLRVWLYHKG